MVWKWRHFVFVCNIWSKNCFFLPVMETCHWRAPYQSHTVWQTHHWCLPLFVSLFLLFVCPLSVSIPSLFVICPLNFSLISFLLPLFTNFPFHSHRPSLTLLLLPPSLYTPLLLPFPSRSSFPSPPLHSCCSHPSRYPISSSRLHTSHSHPNPHSHTPTSIYILFHTSPHTHHSTLSTQTAQLTTYTADSLPPATISFLSRPYLRLSIARIHRCPIFIFSRYPPFMLLWVLPELVFCLVHACSSLTRFFCCSTSFSSPPNWPPRGTKITSHVVIIQTHFLLSFVHPFGGE